MIARIFTVAALVVLMVACSSNPQVVLVTGMGEIEIELFADAAPGHAENFVKLCGDRFFVGTTFHRVIPEFIIQGGDPLSRDDNRANDGTGGPGYRLKPEMSLLHQRGYVAAARMPDRINPEKESSGSQFYICLEDLPQLDGAYTVFGRVVSGMDVVDRIAQVETDARDNPLNPVIIQQTYVK